MYSYCVSNCGKVNPHQRSTKPIRSFIKKDGIQEYVENLKHQETNYNRRNTVLCLHLQCIRLVVKVLTK